MEGLKRKIEEEHDEEVHEESKCRKQEVDPEEEEQESEHELDPEEEESEQEVEPQEEKSEQQQLMDLQESKCRKTELECALAKQDADIHPTHLRAITKSGREGRKCGEESEEDEPEPEEEEKPMDPEDEDIFVDEPDSWEKDSKAVGLKDVDVEAAAIACVRTGVMQLMPERGHHVHFNVFCLHFYLEHNEGHDLEHP